MSSSHWWEALNQSSEAGKKWMAGFWHPPPRWLEFYAYNCDSAPSAGSGRRSYCLAGTFPRSACEHIRQHRLGQQGEVPGASIFPLPRIFFPHSFGFCSGLRILKIIAMVIDHFLIFVFSHFLIFVFNQWPMKSVYNL